SPYSPYWPFVMSVVRLLRYTAPSPSWHLCVMASWCLRVIPIFSVYLLCGCGARKYATTQSGDAIKGCFVDRHPFASLVS
ncbi:MAG: hypothetical protein KDA60_06335, partial [Planctomycetales bacterium]|nr:hypothetical protein [Planctomycetales bacterium]